MRMEKKKRLKVIANLFGISMERVREIIAIEAKKRLESE